MLIQDHLAPSNPREGRGPSVALLRLVTGTWISHAIWLAAGLGIPDLLAERPKDSLDCAAYDPAALSQAHPIPGPR